MKMMLETIKTFKINIKLITITKCFLWSMLISPVIYDLNLRRLVPLTLIALITNLTQQPRIDYDMITCIYIHERWLYKDLLYMLCFCCQDQS